VSDSLSIPWETAWRPAANSWVISLTATLATFMEVLDASVAALLMNSFRLPGEKGKAGGTISVH
jgi:hypothetical protein